MRRWAPGVVVALAAATLSCSDAPDPLLGEWVSVGSEGPRMTYVFEADDRMGWILDMGQGPDTFSLPYTVDDRVDPLHLDVGPWEDGPLSGRTLFGIVDLVGPDRFRLDFEPGDPEGGGAERPMEFTEQTLTFVRKRN